MTRRTATVDQMCAFLIEQGITIRKSMRAVRNSRLTLLDERRDDISTRMRHIILDLDDVWMRLDQRIDAVSEEIAEICEVEKHCRNLRPTPGVGPIISTALVAVVGEAEAFDNGRDMAAWVGLVRRQYSNGGRTTLGGISNRDNRYLRTLRIQAAKIILMRPAKWEGLSFGTWLAEADQRMHRNKLAVALANKLVRIVWAVLRNDLAFDSPRDTIAEAI